MNKRQKINIGMWGLFSIVLTVISLTYILVDETAGMKVIGTIFSVLIAWMLVMIINAWIFNWAFKKFFDKWFKK